MSNKLHFWSWWRQQQDINRLTCHSKDLFWFKWAMLCTMWLLKIIGHSTVRQRRLSLSPFCFCISLSPVPSSLIVIFLSLACSFCSFPQFLSSYAWIIMIFSSSVNQPSIWGVKYDKESLVKWENKDQCS